MGQLLQQTLVPDNAYRTAMVILQTAIIKATAIA
jgi:hypothetical protein